VTRDLLGLEDLFLVQRLPSQLLVTLRAYPLNADALWRCGNCCLLVSVRVRHAHHLLRHPVCFLLVLVAWLVDGQLSLHLGGAGVADAAEGT
jgi:hypothetical protein